MLASLVAVALALPSSQVPGGPARLTAARAPTAVTVDGRLDEPAWSAAPVSDAFTQQYPRDGVGPTKRTEVRVLYDDHALYVGIRCFQSPDSVVALLTRRDRVVPSDRVTVDISSRNDRLSAFHFGVNAAGVLEDGLYFDDATYSADWDENWEARTSIDAEGWTAELRLPLRILRFEWAPTQVWGLQVQRYTEATHEWDLWAYRARAVAGYVSSFGSLEGLEGLRPLLPFELRGTTLARFRTRAADILPSPSAPGHDWMGTIGLDAKAHPTQGTTLDLTLNPDFGQVEADQVVLNLSNYEIFYPEKRPFFLEGIDTFTTPRTVLYTRRIGALPATPTLGTEERLVDQVEPSRIWGAAKLVGAINRRTSIGLLTALTGRNVVDIDLETKDARGNILADTRAWRDADPWALFNAFRLRRLWGAGGDIGLLATAVNRFEPVGQPRLTNDAYVAAMDGHWHSPSANYLVTAQALAAMLNGGPGRTAPDGIITQPGRPAAGATLAIAKQGGGPWLASTTQAFSGRQLDYNDVGYLDRKNDYNAYADLAYRTLEPWRGTTDTTTSVAVSHRQTLKGLSLGDNLRLQSTATFQNFWAVSATAYYHSAFFDDRETKDGTALQRASLVGAELWVGADSRRKLTGAAWVQVQSLANGLQVQCNASFIARPTRRLELEIDPGFEYTSGEPRFIVADAGTYWFGRLRAANVGVVVRGTVGLLPTLTFQLYSQLFLASKHLSSFSTAAGGGEGSSIRLTDLVPRDDGPPAAKPNPDSQTAVFNVNAVLRWEYRLGSVVYLVYTRAQSPSLGVTWPAFPRLDAGSLAGNRGSVDAVLLKASYWWG